MFDFLIGDLEVLLIQGFKYSQQWKTIKRERYYQFKIHKV